MFVSIEDAKQLAESTTQVAWRKFSNVNSSPKIGSTPTIKWRKMGFKEPCRLIDETIFLNLNFLHSEDAEDFIQETTIHNLAHVINKRIYNSFGHDTSWNHICKSMGGKAEELKFSSPKNKKQYKVQCSCSEKEVSKREHSVRKEIKSYCSKCNKEIIAL